MDFIRIKEGFAKAFKKKTRPKEEYVEIDVGQAIKKKTKIIVRPFVLREFDDVNPILDSLREGYTIALINIKQLKKKDIIELKRAIAKLKKTCDALEGDIAGFGEDIIIVTPSFAEISKGREKVEEVEK